MIPRLLGNSDSTEPTFPEFAKASEAARLSVLCASLHTDVAATAAKVTRPRANFLVAFWSDTQRLCFTHFQTHYPFRVGFPQKPRRCGFCRRSTRKSACHAQVSALEQRAQKAEVPWLLKMAEPSSNF